MKRESVFLLHGLMRRAGSMGPMARALTTWGFDVINADYPRRGHELGELVRMLTPQYVQAVGRSDVLHLVGHSMGGLLVRMLLAECGPDRIGRAVLIGTPNQGSEVAARFLVRGPLSWVYGPAARQLGPDRLSAHGPGIPPCPFGVIAGTRRFHPLNAASYVSWAVFGSGIDHDGSVSVRSTQLEGMADFVTVDVNHVVLPRHPEVMRLTRQFLVHGTFGVGG